MVVGVVSSSGGAVFGAAYQLLREIGRSPDARVVTDRACGIERVCEHLGVPHRRFEHSSRFSFSQSAAEWLQAQGAHWACLFFTRLVSGDLHRTLPCVNLHSSLLPSFGGLGALKEALDAKVRFVGATAHVVDDTVDGGTILAQTVAPVPSGADLEVLSRISFAQKLYIFLVLCEHLQEPSMAGTEGVQQALKSPGGWGLPRHWASPALRDTGLESAFWDFVTTEGIPWVR